MITKKWLATAVLADLLSTSLANPIFACAPEFSTTTIFNTSRPDLPLSLYAGGNLGILQPTYAKSYLTVAYLYLNGVSLDDASKKSLVLLWQTRLANLPSQEGDPLTRAVDAYLALRKKIAPSIKSSDFDQKISADAFRNAVTMAAYITQKYGLQSAEAKAYIGAQEDVFAAAAGDKKKLAAIASTDKYLVDCRKYQRAAQAFYQEDYKLADTLYGELAEASPWQERARYMVARTRLTAGNTIFDTEKTLDYIRGMLVTEKDFRRRQDLLALTAPAQYAVLDRPALIGRLIEQIGQPGERLGADIGDLTYAMDEMESGVMPEAGANESSLPEAEVAALEAKRLDQYYARREELMSTHDLTDWLETLQYTERDYGYNSETRQKKMVEAAERHKKHALAMYQKKKNLPWLVAAVMTSGLRGNTELKAAAMEIKSDSPAYHTVNFFVIDALLAEGKLEEARERLTAIDARELSATTRNLYKSQMLKAAKTAKEYLASAIMNGAETASNYDFMPKGWLASEKSQGPIYGPGTFDDEVAFDLNRALPIDMLTSLALAPGQDVDSRILRAAWLKARLLGRRDLSARLAPVVAAKCPAIAAGVREAEASPADDYALARLILKNYGLTPYIASGVERHALKIGEFDEYNLNFWVPQPLKAPQIAANDYYPYENFHDDFGTVIKPRHAGLVMDCVRDNYKSGIERVLDEKEKKAAASELSTLVALSPAKVAGDAVFKRQKTNPSDASLPELLYRVVKLPKWSFKTDQNSQYSHRAHTILHQNYKGSSYARQAPYWY